MSNQYCNFCFEQDAIKKGQHCCDSHFEEIKNICHNKDFDCGLTWDYRCDSINTNKYAGLLQFEDGTYFEILPKISDDVESGRKIFRTKASGFDNNTSSDFLKLVQGSTVNDSSSSLLNVAQNSREASSITLFIRFPPLCKDFCLKLIIRREKNAT